MSWCKLICLSSGHGAVGAISEFVLRQFAKINFSALLMQLVMHSICLNIGFY